MSDNSNNNLDLIITKKDLDSNNYYIGKIDVSDYNNQVNSIKIEGSLGRVKFQEDMYARSYIIAEAGSGIEAGDEIEAGSRIKAGSGIKAGLTISCKLALSCSYNIFAGLAIWEKTDLDGQKIICGKLESGEVKLGILEETGLPEEKSNEVKTINVGGIDYIITPEFENELSKLKKKE